MNRSEQFEIELKELIEAGAKMRELRQELMMVQGKVSERTAAFMNKYYSIKPNQEVTMGEILARVLDVEKKTLLV